MAGETSQLEATFAQQILALGLPEPEREYQFDEARKWKFDFAWPEKRVAVEIDGRGHQRDSRYYGDIEKGNRAALVAIKDAVLQGMELGYTIAMFRHPEIAAWSEGGLAKFRVAVAAALEAYQAATK